MSECGHCAIIICSLFYLFLSFFRGFNYFFCCVVCTVSFFSSLDAWASASLQGARLPQVYGSLISLCGGMLLK